MGSLDVLVCVGLPLSWGTQHVCKHMAWKEDSDKESRPVAHHFLFVSDSMLPLAANGAKNLREQRSFIFFKVQSLGIK